LPLGKATKLFVLNASQLGGDLRNPSSSFGEFSSTTRRGPTLGGALDDRKGYFHISQGFAIVAVSRLKERGDPWQLNEESPTAKPPAT
jgi:hypothetical protein